MNALAVISATLMLASVVMLEIDTLSKPKTRALWQRSLSCAYWSVFYAWFSSLPYVNRYYYQGVHYVSHA